MLGLTNMNDLCVNSLLFLTRVKFFVLKQVCTYDLECYFRNLMSNVFFSSFVLQSAGLPWSLAKGQDTFTPISSIVRNCMLQCLFMLKLFYNDVVRETCSLGPRQC